ncbi:unnamed protein product [Ostreobium quekettii]|uniref:PROP1-like PPR domain-containing protein n=1 Tax=Ostreobium quekettii TaxID=121088 RepID=A0A8S1IZU2_9CHLO|nr:unnamed protein product [Ostreobium quekettii]
MSGQPGPSGQDSEGSGRATPLGWVAQPGAGRGQLPASAPVNAPVHASPYDTEGLHGARPARDMDGLKAAIHVARAGRMVPGRGVTEARFAIETASFQLREAAFTALINLCGRLRDAPKAFEVFEAMRDYGSVTPNTYTYSSLISACVSSGDWAAAMDVFAGMKEAAARDAGCRPNEVTYSALITACEREGKSEIAMGLYDEMLGAGILPDKVTFCSALTACLKSNMWERAEEIVEDMHGRGMCATSNIYLELLQGYGRRAEWSKGLDLFLTMQMMGRDVDKHCCRALMTAFEAGGRHQMALQLLEAMENKVAADLPTYTSALRTMAAAGRWREASGVMSLILESGLRPDEEAVGVAVRACVEAGQKEEARKVVAALEAAGVVVGDDVKASAE